MGMIPGKCSLVHLVIDVSPSMGEQVKKQVLQADKIVEDEIFNTIIGEACPDGVDKVCLAYASLAAMLEYLHRARDLLRRPSLQRRLFSASLLGLPPGDPRIPAVPAKPIVDVVDEYSKARGTGASPVEAASKALGLDVEWLRSLSRSEARYTDGACAGQGLKASLEAATRTCSRLGRVLVLCFSDCCVNDFEGRAEGGRLDPAGAAEETRAILEQAAGEAGVESLSVVALLYGDPALVEVEQGVCPLRAARIADRLSALEVRFREVAEQLRGHPGLAADKTWAGIEVNGVPLAEYAIRRVRSPEALAHMLLVATTTTTS